MVPLCMVSVGVFFFGKVRVEVSHSVLYYTYILFRSPMGHVPFTNAPLLKLLSRSHLVCVDFFVCYKDFTYARSLDVIYRFEYALGR